MVAKPKCQMELIGVISKWTGFARETLRIFNWCSPIAVCTVWLPKEASSVSRLRCEWWRSIRCDGFQKRLLEIDIEVMCDWIYLKVKFNILKVAVAFIGINRFCITLFWHEWWCVTSASIHKSWLRNTTLRTYMLPFCIRCSNLYTMMLDSSSPLCGVWQ